METLGSGLGAEFEYGIEFRCYSTTEWIGIVVFILRLYGSFDIDTAWLSFSTETFFPLE